MFKDFLIDDQCEEVANLCLFRGICSNLSVFVEWNTYTKCIVDDSHLEVTELLCNMISLTFSKKQDTYIETFREG